MNMLALAIVSTLLLVSAAGAHPGHGEPGQGFTAAHHLTEPVHILAVIAFVFIVATAAKAVRGQRRPALRATK